MMETRRPVYFSGENPAMSLYFTGAEEIAAMASYWRCHDGPRGPGSALFLWVSPRIGTAESEGRSSAASASAVYTDNPALALSLSNDLVRHFSEFERVPIAELPVVPARLAQDYDGESYRVRCRAGGKEVEVHWEAPLDRKQILEPRFNCADQAFDLNTVIRPCERGFIIVDGGILPVAPRRGVLPDGFPWSSAFLAFAETWVGPVPSGSHR